MADPKSKTPQPQDDGTAAARGQPGWMAEHDGDAASVNRNAPSEQRSGTASQGDRAGSQQGSQTARTGQGDGQSQGSSQGLAGAQGSGGGAERGVQQPPGRRGPGDNERRG